MLVADGPRPCVCGEPASSRPVAAGLDARPRQPWAPPTRLPRTAPRPVAQPCRGTLRRDGRPGAHRQASPPAGTAEGRIAREHLRSVCVDSRPEPWDDLSDDIAPPLALHRPAADGRAPADSPYAIESMAIVSSTIQARSAAGGTGRVSTLPLNPSGGPSFAGASEVVSMTRERSCVLDKTLDLTISGTAPDPSAPPPRP